MPFSYRTHNDTFKVFVYFEGALDDADARAFVSFLRADPALKPCMPVIIDATGITGSRLIRWGIKSVVDILERINISPDEARAAVVVYKTGLALVSDMLRMAMENRGLKHRLRTFVNEAEAHHWLAEMPVSV